MVFKITRKILLQNPNNENHNNQIGRAGAMLAPNSVW